MKLLLKLAWRNIWRNRRRSILTILAILFATFLTIVMRGLSTGTWEYNVKSTVGLFSGYVQIQRMGYQDNPSLARNFEYPGGIVSMLEGQPSITGFAPRILADGLVSVGDNSSGAILFGIDPIAERPISRFHLRTQEGEHLASDGGQDVVIGKTLLKNLNAHVGDTLVILAQGADGVMGNERFHIRGTIKLGSPDFDGMLILMDIVHAQRLLALQGKAHVVAIGLGDIEDVTPFQDRMKAHFDDHATENLTALSWSEVLPELKQAMEFDIIGDWFFLGILIIIVAFGVLNTVLMSVTERFREFGVSLAVGMQPHRLVALVLLETGYIALTGIALGVAAGHALNIWFAAHPYRFGGEMAAMYEEYGFEPLVTASSDAAIPLFVTLVMLCVALLSCIYPAYRVSRLEPLKGIRYT